jgi:GNAT superfamily N-acetyltransferase
MRSVTYRHPSPSDLNAITDVLNKSRAEIPFYPALAPEELNIETFLDADYDLNGVWLAFVDGLMVGYAHGLVEKARLAAGMDDGWVSVEVVPDHRRQGIEQELMRRVLEYLLSRGVSQASHGRTHQEPWRIALSVEFGFADVRHYFRMRWTGEVPPAMDPMPGGYELEKIVFKEATDAQVRETVDALNESFSGHFNFVPQTPEKTMMWREEGRDYFRIAILRKSGRIAGLCMSGEFAPPFGSEGKLVGWISALGVVGPHRRKGLGGALLSEGMRWAFDRGHHTMFIELDAENRKALTLYTSKGFVVDKEDVYYRKGLR